MVLIIRIFEAYRLTIPFFETHRLNVTRDPPPDHTLPHNIFEMPQFLDQGNLNESFGPGGPELSFKFPAPRF